MHAVPFGEALDQVLLVRADANEDRSSRRRSGRAVALARQNIDAGPLGHRAIDTSPLPICALGSRLRGNDADWMRIPPHNVTPAGGGPRSIRRELVTASRHTSHQPYTPPRRWLKQGCGSNGRDLKRVELDADEPGVVGQLDDLGQQPVG